MDATDREMTEPAVNDTTSREAPICGTRSRWVAVVALPVLVMAVVGAGRVAMNQVIGRVDVLPAVHVAPAPEADAAPLGRMQAVESQELGSVVPDFLPEDLPPAEPTEEPSAQYRVVETILMEVTAYCPCKKCCGPLAHGVTASGKPVSYNGGRFVAADIRVLPFDSIIRVPGYHDEVPVEVIDRGGAIKGRKLDVYFPDHQTALQWGRQILPVQVLERIEE